VARHQDRWKRAKTLHLSSDASGFKHLRRYLDKFSTLPTDFLILLEPTGGYYALTLLSYLIGEGYTVLQVENKAVKDYREKIFGSETKTDDTDARLMARMGFLHEMVGEEFSIQPVRLTNPDDAALRVTLAPRWRAAQVPVWSATWSSSKRKSPGGSTNFSRWWRSLSLS